MTMQENITRIANAKEALRTSIINKGVSVEESALIDVYSSKVNEIPQGTTKVNWQGKIYFTYTENDIKYYVCNKANSGFSSYLNNAYLFNDLKTSILGITHQELVRQNKMVGRYYDLTIKTGELYISIAEQLSFSWNTAEDSPLICVSEDEQTTQSIKSLIIPMQDVITNLTESQDIEIPVVIIKQ